MSIDPRSRLRRNDVISRLLNGDVEQVNILGLIEIVNRMFRGGHLRGSYLLIRVMRSDGRILDHIISEDNINERLSVLSEGIEPSFDETSESDPLYILRNVPLTTAQISYHRARVGKGRRRGGFFPYYNKMNIDLSRYGIYTREQVMSNKASENNDHCIIVALRSSGMFDKYDLMNVSNCLSLNKSSSKTLKEIGDWLKCKIKVNRIDKEYKKKGNYKYIDKEATYDKEIKLGLFKEHYFLIDRVENVNLKRIKKPIYNEGNQHKMERKKHTDFKGNQSVNISKLLNDVFNKNMTEEERNVLFEEILYDDLMNRSIHKRKVDKIGSLDYLTDGNYFDKLNVKGDLIDRDPVHHKPCKMNIPRKDKLLKPHIKIFFDFEADPTSIPHKPYMVSFVNENARTPIVFSLRENGESFVEAFMDGITNYVKKKEYEINKDKDKEDRIKLNLIMYAHNLLYDFQFLSKYGYNVNHIASSNSIYSTKMKYNGVMIEYRDTYKMINVSLDKFKDLFNLDIEKEVMPYELYSGRYIKDLDTMPLSIVEDYYNKRINNGERDYHKFLENIQKLNLFTEDGLSFYHIKYCEFYCNRDVIVMRDGMKKFKEGFLKMSEGKIDIFEYLTISSVSKNFFQQLGILWDTYSIRGLPRKFIQGAMVGGRCMIANNQKRIIKNRKIIDMDANGLYLKSAQYMGEIGGTLKGFPTPFDESDKMKYETLKGFDGYYVDILVKKVGVDLPFPIYCIVEDDKNNWTNDLEGRIIRIDKIMLEMLIEFQEIEFEVIRGYIYYKGRNPTIYEVATNLHEERLKLKRQGNPLEKVYKLCGNGGIYGKLIEKPRDTEKFLFNKKKDYENRIQQNYYKVKRGICSEENNYYEVELYKEFDKHFNNIHIGCEILSISKLVMNRLMVLAHHNNIEVFYSDTDSCPFDYEKIDELDRLYTEKYGETFLDKEILGKFSNDFKHDDCDKGVDIYATYSIYVAKKTYYNKVRYECKEEEMFYDHYRSKGFPSDVISNYCIKHNINVGEFYTLLAYGMKFNIDLIKYSDKPKFIMENGVMVSRLEYSKTFVDKTSLLITDGYENEMIEVEDLDRRREIDCREILDKMVMDETNIQE